MLRVMLLAVLVATATGLAADSDHALLIGYTVTAAVVLAGCVATVVWGGLRGWEMELLVPFAAAFLGTAGLGAMLLVSVVVHDHLQLAVR